MPKGKMWVREAVVVSASPESPDEVLEFLKAYRDWKQYIIDQIWNEEKVPNIREMHYRFYYLLRKVGFRGHTAEQIYREDKTVVKATKKNKGSKPILRRLSAIVHKQDFRLYIDREELRLAVLNNKRITFKLKIPEYAKQKFKDWEPVEVCVKFQNGQFFVAIVFRRKVRIKEYYKSALAVDVNFDNVTLVIKTPKKFIYKRFQFPIKKALTHKVWAERIQKRYNTTWRFYKGVLEAIRKHHRRARNILIDACHKISRMIVELAQKYDACIVIEDLKYLKENAKRDSGFNKKLSLFAYRKLLSYIEYKALERGIKIVKVNPKRTSKLCPHCHAKMEIWYGRIERCSVCGYVGDRDVIACLNLLAKCGGCRCPLNASKPDEAPRGCGGIG